MLSFKVSVSSVIKRKKSWPILKWIGHSKQSVCLMDKSRISILYLPSGRTKRSISALHPYMNEAAIIETSSDGSFVILLLTSGRLVRWHKDSNSVTIIKSCSDFNLISSSGFGDSKLFISNDGTSILLLINFHSIWLCEIDANIEMNKMIEGKWSSISLGIKSFESLSFKETSADCKFFRSQEEGFCCLCSIVCNIGEQLLLHTLLIRWHQPHNLLFSPSTFSSSTRHDFVPLTTFNSACKPIRHHGAYLLRLSPDGNILAIFINQRQPSDSLLVFVHPYTYTFIKTDLKALGSTSPKVLSKFSKSYWVADASWTSDSLFLTCITKRGSIMVFARLGGAMLLTTRGMGMEYGPTFFLPLLPCIEYEKPPQQKFDGASDSVIDVTPSITSTTVSESKSRQRFSITTHPNLPILLCSDGFNVISLQLHELMQIPDLASNALFSANKILRDVVKTFKFELKACSAPRLDLRNALVESAKFKEHYLYEFISNFKKKLKKRKRRTDQSVADNSGHANDTSDEVIKLLAYKFEEMEQKNTDEDGGTDEDVDEHFGVISNADRGKVRFGDITEESCIFLEDDEVALDAATLLVKIDDVIVKLRHAWSLMMSEDMTMTSQKKLSKTDHLEDFFLDTLDVFFTLILEAQDLCLYLPWIHEEVGINWKKSRRALSDCVSEVFRSFAHLTVWNGSLKMSSFVRRTLRMSLNTLLKCRRTSPEGCINIRDLSHNIASSLSLLHRIEVTMNRAFNYQPTHLKVVDGDQLMVDTYHKQHVQGSSPGPVILIQLWSDLNHLLVQLHGHPDYSQIHRGLLLAHVHVQSRINSMSTNPLELVDQSPSNSDVTFMQMDIYLCDYRLDEALDLADRLSTFSGADWSEARPVELLATVMTSYFTNDKISFKSRSTFAPREFVLDRSRIVDTIRDQRLSLRWTVDATTRYLFRCGRLLQSVHFSDQLGDWRTALVLASMSNEVRALPTNSRRCDVILREEFQRRVSVAFDSDDDVMSAFEPERLYTSLLDLYLVAVMVGSDLASWSVDLVSQKLKEECSKAPLIAPDDLYLPAPPIYLPQPTSGSSSEDLVRRSRISCLLRTLLVMFHSLGATLHLSEDSSDLKESPETLSISRAFQLCSSLLWMLETRDRVTSSLRDYQRHKEQNTDEIPDAAEKVLQLLLIFKPFISLIDCQTQFQHLVFSVTSSLPVTSQLVTDVAKLMPGSEVPPKMQERFRAFETRLRQVSHDEHSLMSIFFHKERARLSTDDVTIEHDQYYRHFIEQFYDVITDRYATLTSPWKQSKDAKKSGLMLVLSNRRQLAINQLLPTPKRVTSDDVTFAFSLDACVPEVKKRMLKLEGFASWLVTWSAKTLARDETRKASIRIRFTCQDLILGVAAAEMRFSKRLPASQDPLKIPASQDPLKIPASQDPLKLPASQDPIKIPASQDLKVPASQDLKVPASQDLKLPASQDPLNSSTISRSQSSRDQLPPKPAPLSKDHKFSSPDPSLSQNPHLSEDLVLTPSAALEEAVVMTTEDDEEITQVSSIPMEHRSPASKDHKLKEDPDTSPITGKSSNQRSSFNFRSTAFGSSPKSSDATLPDLPNISSLKQDTSSDLKKKDVSEVVRSEIHNVLLAQQVSLLSQILLGQTLAGKSEDVATNPLVGALLQNLQPNTRGQCVESKPPDAVVKATSHATPLLKINKDSKTPLNYFRGIPLIQLPENRKLNPPKLIINKKPEVTKISSKPTSGNFRMLRAPPPQQLPQQPPQIDPIQKTQFPLKMPEVHQDPIEPKLIPLKRDTQSSSLPHFINIRPHPDPDSRPIRLINPKEVLGLRRLRVEVSKQISAPPPLRLIGIGKIDVSEKENVNPSSPPKRSHSPPVKLNHKVTKINIQSQTSRELFKDQSPPKKEFQGFCDPQKIRDEVENALMKGKIRGRHDPSDYLSSGQAHCLACFGKRPMEERAVKRLKSVKQQTESKDASDEEEKVEDYKDQMKTKPLQAPPEVFMKLRLDYEKLDEDDDKKKFLHMVDVKCDDVKRGLDLPQQIPDPEKISYDPGFKIEDQVKEATKVLEVRETTRSSWLNSMKQMNLQLLAMEQASNRIREDFKNSTKLVKKVETIAEIRSNDRALSPIKESSRIDLEEDLDLSQDIFKPRLKLQAPRFERFDLGQKNVTDHHKVVFKDQLDEAYKLLKRPLELDCPLVDKSKASLPLQATTDLPMSEEEVVLTDEEYNTWKSHIMSFVESEDDFLEEVKSSSPKKTGVIKNDKKDLHLWMKMKKKERNRRYMDQIKFLREAETHPFQGTSQHLTSKQLEEMNKERMAQKRERDTRFMDARVQDGMELIDEIKNDNIFRNRCLNRGNLRTVKRENGNFVSRSNYHSKPYTKPPADTSMNRTASDDDDLKSIMSDWTLDSKVRQILYGDKKDAESTFVSSKKSPSTIDMKEFEDHNLDVTTGSLSSHDTLSLLGGMQL